ncbi:hypothetical protein [Fodinicola feengrottensis]|uniref:hypothetical protein n=1 Tax=Fodinicola feengrottensis TaxID=435914 RepID=UPI002443495B|nr:hypothetical protein [Fodinicola feengrottensis]
MRTVLFRLLVALTTLAGLLTVTPAVQAAPPDIADQLKQLPGVVSVTEQSTAAPYRYFQLVFRQLVDHNNPRKGYFEQRVGLMHRDASAPMVMYTTGYNYRGIPFRSEPRADRQRQPDRRRIPLLRAVPASASGLVEADHLAGRHRPARHRPGA